jgi:hypothetical protein
VYLWENKKPTNKNEIALLHKICRVKYNMRKVTINEQIQKKFPMFFANKLRRTRRKLFNLNQIFTI